MATTGRHRVIYETVNAAAPIRQGDIFAGIPRVEVSLDELSVVDETDQPESTSWAELLKESRERITAICSLKPVSAIVISQDCDNLRASDVSLCEIRPIADVDGAFKTPKGADWWAKMIPQQCQRNLKWFYLPPDPLAQFNDRMAADFRITIRVALADLRALTHLRRVRLNPEADEHFRERLSEFFRRYPYDEWYPLDPNEFAAYQRHAPEAVPKAWQTQPPR